MTKEYTSLILFQEEVADLLCSIITAQSPFFRVFCSNAEKDYLSRASP